MGECMEQNGALSVTQLNNYIKELMERDDLLCSVTLRAEISNFKKHSSGHIYFTLKDEHSEISAVMFKGAAMKLSFAPQSGMRVTVYGRVSVYEVTGKYQVVVSAMTADGAGDLYEQFIRLREKLKAEGLFALERKKAIPTFPKRIGIVTSPTGAAIRDMINVTGRRYPSAELLISPALVQGAEAPADLCRALCMLDGMGECDVIIIGRGGGSMEDLWAFNDETLVRTVAAASTPIISAVGHETDVTLCDYVADMRAPTPSAAAERAVPDRLTLMQSVDEKEQTLDRLFDGKLSSYKIKLGNGERQLSALSPNAKLKSKRDKLVTDRNLLDARIDAIFKQRKMTLSAAVGRLETANPLDIIKRGYSMTTDQDGRVVSKISDVKTADLISVRVLDGVINATVTDVKALNEV